MYFIMILMEKFRLVKAYYDTQGHIKMPRDYVVEGGWLRRWLSEQVARLNGRPTGRNNTVKRLKKEQIEALKSIGVFPDLFLRNTRSYHDGEIESQRSSV